MNTCSTIFSFSVLGYFCYPFFFFHKVLPYGQRGRCPRRMLRMRLGRTMGRFCGQGEKHPLLPGEVLPPWATSTRPPDFGSIAPTLLRRFPAKAGSPRLRFGGLTGKSNIRCRPGCLLHPHFGRTSPLRQRTHNRKSGPVGYRKKGGERTELSRVISLFIKKCGNSYSVSYVERQNKRKYPLEHILPNNLLTEPTSS
jgi:hypothetical protein